MKGLGKKLSGGIMLAWAVWMSFLLYQTNYITYQACFYADNAYEYDGLHEFPDVFYGCQIDGTYNPADFRFHFDPKKN